MARTRIYIKPFLPAGANTGAYGDWIEVTQYCDAGSIGNISRKLDISDYDVGVYTNSSVSFALKNNTGKFSDVGNIGTIFGYKRNDSQVKITWDLADYDFFAGCSSTYDILGNEVVIYQGLLSDDSSAMQIANQEVSFDILGYESIFDSVLAPDWVGTPPADNLASTLIKGLLAAANAGATSPVFTIDPSKITCSNDITWDDLAVFATKTCREALNIILLGSNSVLYFDTDFTTPITSGRVPSVAVLKTFYGPGSSLGPENISDLRDIRTGQNRIINYLAWTGTLVSSSDEASIAAYGIKKKEFTVDGITDGSKWQPILDSYKSEFGTPKQEFILITPMTYDALALPLLARIAFDFPVISVDAAGLPLYEIATYDGARYPIDLTSFQILVSETHKVIGIDLAPAQNQISFLVRRI